MFFSGARAVLCIYLYVCTLLDRIMLVMERSISLSLLTPSCEVFMLWLGRFPPPFPPRNRPAWLCHPPTLLCFFSCRKLTGCPERYAIGVMFYKG